MTESSSTEVCRLCGSQLFSRVYPPRVRVQNGASFKMTTDVFGSYGEIVRCRNCSLVSQVAVSTPQDIQSGYSEMVDQDYLTELESRAINALIALQTIKQFRTSGRLLDIGCSLGFLLNGARIDFEVKGVEPSEWAATLARDKFKLDVTQGFFEKMDWPENHFDVVAMIDVIEHLTDPLSCLKKVWSTLRPGGLLYLVTPDVNSLSARILGRYWWGLRPVHLFYFSKKTMGRILSEVGFEVKAVRSYGRIFTYGYWLSRIRNYPAALYKTIGWFIKAAGLQNKILYLNTRDSMEVLATKKA